MQNPNNTQGIIKYLNSKSYDKELNNVPLNKIEAFKIIRSQNIKEIEVGLKLLDPKEVYTMSVSVLILDVFSEAGSHKVFPGWGSGLVRPGEGNVGSAAMKTAPASQPQC